MSYLRIIELFCRFHSDFFFILSILILYCDEPDTHILYNFNNKKKHKSLRTLICNYCAIDQIKITEPNLNKFKYGAKTNSLFKAKPFRILSS